MKMKVINLDKVIKKINKIASITDDELETGIKNMTGEIVPNVREYTPVDRGTLSNSIQDTLEKDGDVIRGIVRAENIAPVIVASVAGGTRPHWPPWGPGSALAGWARRKGIPVFLVARAIARFGTIKRFGRPKGGAKMFDKGLADSMNFIKDEIDRIKKRVIKRAS